MVIRQYIKVPVSNLLIKLMDLAIELYSTLSFYEHDGYTVFVVNHSFGQNLLMFNQKNAWDVPSNIEGALTKETLEYLRGAS